MTRRSFIRRLVAIPGAGLLAGLCGRFLRAKEGMAAAPEFVLVTIQGRYGDAAGKYHCEILDCRFDGHRYGIALDVSGIDSERITMPGTVALGRQVGRTDDGRPLVIV